MEWVLSPSVGVLVTEPSPGVPSAPTVMPWGAPVLSGLLHGEHHPRSQAGGFLFMPASFGSKDLGVLLWDPRDSKMSPQGDAWGQGRCGCRDGTPRFPRGAAEAWGAKPEPPVEEKPPGPATCPSWPHWGEAAGTGRLSGRGHLACRQGSPTWGHARRYSSYQGPRQARRGCSA